ncbi:hypothetical protein [Streptomyces sp. NPDC060366]|uniref:hypothetical protein n=1 Tax=Streptomyces sp. NPDC060366 TaxID=3347105 RepID=UPI003650A63E
MADMTYSQLQQAVTGLSKDITKASGAIRGRAQVMDEEAQDTARVAQQIGGMGVDPATTSETQELARIMKGVSEAAIAYASAGDTTAKTANAAFAQGVASHGGIQEAHRRSTVDMSNLKPEWLRQE